MGTELRLEVWTRVCGYGILLMGKLFIRYLSLR